MQNSRDFPNEMFKSHRHRRTDPRRQTTHSVRSCGGFWMRIINPSGNLSNMLSLKGELSETPGANSQLELVVVAVSDRLLQCSYVEGQEIPVSTTVTDIL
jgi:hypothetical protein